MIKPKAPSINGLLKIHKPNAPIRPLINFTTAPTYRIAKHLNQWLTSHIRLNENKSIKNNMELVDNIQSITIPSGAKLVSFDVENMYPNIPTLESIMITAQLLIENDVEPQVVIEVVVAMLKTIMQQNYFQHENKFYQQTDGLPMGNPLSGTLANIYLNYLERTYIFNDKNKHYKNIIYWYRYVDDILLLFQGTHRQLDNLHNYINHIEDNITFTMEIEKNKTINFLDLTIINANQKHKFKIHRKMTQTNHTIHNTSNHPNQHKMSAYNHMLNRLNRIPMDENDYVEELNTIIYIAKCNGYREDIINNINTRIKNKIQRFELTTLHSDDTNTKKYIPIEYNKSTYNTIKKFLYHKGYTIAAKTNNKLQRIFNNNNKHKQTIECGVYKLVCNECDKFYIGQTGRTFAQRFKEHTDEIRNTNVANIRSNYAQHLATTNHTYTDFDKNLKILHRLQKGNTMDRIEELEIYQHKNNPLLLNDKVNTKANIIYDIIIKETNNARQKYKNRNRSH